MSDPLGLGMEEPADRHGAFPRLDDEQRSRLRALGANRVVQPGEVLFREGDDSYDFFVVERGAVAIVRGYGDENRVIAVHGPHRFLGELNLLTGARVNLTAVVRDAGEVIQVPVDRLRHVVAEDEELSNLILRAYLARRSILIEAGGGVRLVGSRYSLDSRRLREFLARNRVPYHWMDLEDDEEAERLLQTLGVAPTETPVVVGGPSVLRNPSNGELGALLGLGSRGAPPPMCDLVIVGGGPRGWRPRSTEPRRASTPRRSTRWPSADRRAPRRASRTTSAFRPGISGTNWPSARRSRPRSSAPASRCPPRRSGWPRGRPFRHRARRRRQSSTAAR